MINVAERVAVAVNVGVSVSVAGAVASAAEPVRRGCRGGRGGHGDAEFVYDGRQHVLRQRQGKQKLVDGRRVEFQPAHEPRQLQRSQLARGDQPGQLGQIIGVQKRPLGQHLLEKGQLGQCGPQCRLHFGFERQARDDGVQPFRRQAQRAAATRPVRAAGSKSVGR